MPNDTERKRDVERAVQASVEATIYVSPRAHGLREEELVEVCSRVGIQRGELFDVLPKLLAGRLRQDDERLVLQDPVPWFLADFGQFFEPDPRNPKAFTFVLTELRNIARAEGLANARIELDVLVSRGEQAGLPRKDVDVAVVLLELGKRVERIDSTIHLLPNGQTQHLPAVHLQERRRPPEQREWLCQVLPVVEDVLSRRSDGRPAVAEPLRAFALELERLGQGKHRAWWELTRSELERSDPSLQPTTACVLAAALSEACLMFMVPAARARATTGFDRFDASDPRNWKFVDLLHAAKRAQILTEDLVQRGITLNTIRQRIHVARLLVDDVGAHPDTRPEEAREAKNTVDLIARRVIDWLRAEPPKSKAP